jgi:hypothetical protein
MNRILLVVTSATLVACSSIPNAPTGISANQTATPPAKGDHMILPTLGGPMPQLQSGDITFTGDTGPGTATFSNAAAQPDDRAPATYGSGAFSITVGSNTYAANDGQSLFATLSDDAGVSYLAIALMAAQPSADRVQMVYAVVPQTDFAPGADVALDATQRYALYAAGPQDGANPDTLAVATIGTIHFDASSSLTGAITASLSGTFAAADPSAFDSGSPDGGGSTGTETEPPPVPGPYTMHFGAPVDAHCQGTLAGHENEFLIDTASFFAVPDQTVQFAAASGSVLLTGTQLAPMFGTNSWTLTISPEVPYWQYETNVASVLGPESTILAAFALLLDTTTGPPYRGQAVAAFAPPNGTASDCELAYDVTFTP